jgi:DNA-binding CsgD family transcriptional regulator
VSARDRAARTAALDLLVRIASALSDRNAMIGARNEIDEIADRLNTDPLRAIAASSRGFAAMADAQWDAARASFEDAVDLFTQAGLPFEAARARMDRACVLDAAGRRDDALEDALAARNAFESLGAAGEVARADAMCSRLQATPESTSARPPESGTTPFDRLTAREREVLKLVGKGLSNPDIARRLGLSQHTVHRHISNILTKLDLPSRTAAAAAAVRSGAI